MKARTLIFLSILFLVVLIAAINWTVFTTPVPLNLLFTSVNVPIGLSMLMVIGVLSFLYLFFVWKTQTSAFFESRRKNTEVEKARKLADSEEASRVATLKKLVEDEMQGVNAKLDLLMSQFNVDAPPQEEENVVEKMGDSLKNIGKKIKQSM